MLLGTFEHNLDEKLRLTIPSKLRNQLGDTIYVSKGFEGCLEIRSQTEFEIWYKEISQHSSTNSNARLVARQIFSNSAEIDFDSAGRIKLPSNLLNLAEITKNVLILGIGDKIEIWDVKKYQDYSNGHLTDLEEVANQLGGAK